LTALLLLLLLFKFIAPTINPHHEKLFERLEVLCCVMNDVTDDVMDDELKISKNHHNTTIKTLAIVLSKFVQTWG
jgi:hypothetical protein